MDARLLTTPCTILTKSAGTVDEYGDPTVSEAQTTALCHIEPLQAFEQLGEALEQTRWRVFLPATPLVGGEDALLISGERYSLVGDPGVYRRPTSGQVDHQELVVQRTR